MGSERRGHDEWIGKSVFPRKEIRSESLVRKRDVIFGHVQWEYPGAAADELEHGPKDKAGRSDSQNDRAQRFENLSGTSAVEQIEDGRAESVSGELRMTSHDDAT